MTLLLLRKLKKNKINKGGMVIKLTGTLQILTEKQIFRF